MSAMRRSESQHYTTEQVEQHAEEALAIIRRLNPPKDLRVVCFAKTYELLAAKQMFWEQVTVNAGHLLAPKPHT